MDSYINRTIKKFVQDGTAVDQEAIIRIRPELESHLIDEMRGKGYVPILDITPELFWEFKNPNFKFAVIIYGTFVGKKKAKEIMGLLGAHPLWFEPYNGDVKS